MEEYTLRRVNSYHSMDGRIHAGDVVVTRVNGTVDLFLIATVVSADEDLDLQILSTSNGREAAIRTGYARRSDDRQNVWLFAGSAAAYVKTAAPREALSHV